MTNILSQLGLTNYLLDPTNTEVIKYDVSTDEGYKNAIELLAQARKLVDDTTTKTLFGSLLNNSFVEFLDKLYAQVVETHNAAVKKRAEEAQKTDFDKLSEVDQQNVTTAVDKYLEKYKDASEETKNLAKDILKDYTAWVIHSTREGLGL